MKPAPEARKASVPLPFFQRVCVLLDSLKPDSSANYRCVSSGDKSLYLLRLTPAFNHLLSDFFLITYWRIASCFTPGTAPAAGAAVSRPIKRTSANTGVRSDRSLNNLLLNLIIS